VCYLHTWESRFAAQYAALVERLGAASFRPVVVDDPDAAWALGRAGDVFERALGHELLAD
jgi:hypothetical protein